MFMLMSGGRHPFVDQAGKLDERRLQDGALDFASQGLLGAFFVQNGGFSEESRRFCRRLVNPKSADRMTAEGALQDSWMAKARTRTASKEEGDIVRQVSRKGEANGYPAADASPSAVFGMNNVFGWILGEDQNKPPNVNGETDQEKEVQRYQAVTSQLDALQHTPGMKKENADMKNRIAELENEKRELHDKLQKADAMKRQVTAAPQPSARAGGGGSNQPRITRRETDVRGGSIAGPYASNRSNGGLDANLKVRYNSSTAARWLPATVERFNESNGTYDLSVRAQANVSNISPDPLVRMHEAWPEGTRVSYLSPTAGKSLDAIIVSFVEGTGGINGTYNLDVRECADCDRIRPRAL